MMWFCMEGGGFSGFEGGMGFHRCRKFSLRILLSAVFRNLAR